MKISRNIIALGFVSLFTDIASEMIFPLLPIFLTQTLGASKAFLGLVEGIAESASSILKLFSGYLSDKLKLRKAIVVVGYTISTFVRPLVGISQVGWHVLGVRFLDRVGKGLRTSPRDVLIADSSKHSDRGLSFGFQRSMDNLGAVIGPIVATILIVVFLLDLRTVFLLAFIPGIVTMLILLFFVKEIKPRVQPKDTITPSSGQIDRNFKWYLLALFIFTLGNSSDAFLLLRANELGIEITYIPILWSLLNVIKSLGATPGGWLSDKIGRIYTISIGWIVYALVYLGFGFANTLWQVWVLFIIYGIYYGLTEGAERALVSDLVETQKRGTAYGLYNFVIGITVLPASIVFGIIWQKWGSVFAFSLGAGLALCAVILIWLFVKKI
jgi:MFS family permease